MQHVWRDMRGIPFNPIALDYRAYDLFISQSSGFTHCVILYTYTAERRDVLGCTSPTASRAEGNLEVGGDVQPYTSLLWAVYGHSLIINPSLGMYQEIHPCRASSTYSVKINTSLPMMGECQIHDQYGADGSFDEIDNRG